MSVNSKLPTPAEDLDQRGGLPARAGTEQAIEQHGQHDQREGHVHAIAFDGESHDGEDNAGDGSGDEEEQSELD
jgi:hypothetical protein